LKSHYGAAYVLVFGVFCGSASWWVLLSATADRLRLKFDAFYIRKINQFSGVLITGFGLFVMVSAFFV
jgi:arginine exporter protein ArgO